MSRLTPGGSARREDPAEADADDVRGVGGGKGDAVGAPGVAAGNAGADGDAHAEHASRVSGVDPGSGAVDEVEVLVRRLDPVLPLPTYAHPGDAGLDLHAAADATLQPGERALVPTGLAVQLPPSHVGLVHPRSGLAARHGVTVLNAPGTVDAGYRGEILVNLVNHDPVSPFAVRRGDRIAQLLIQRVARARLVEADVLSETRRGQTGHGDSGGFGPPAP